MNNILRLALVLLTYTSIHAQEVNASNDRPYVIKYGLLQPFIAGEIPFSFEHAFHPSLSYEVTAGLTISDLVMNLSSRPDFLDSKAPSTLDNPKLGFVIQAALRIYPIKSIAAPKGFFIAPELKFRQYQSDYSAHGVYPGTVVVATRPLNHFILRLNIGYQFIIKNALAIDLFGGIGINNRSGNFPIVNWGYDPVTDQYQTVVEEYQLKNAIPHMTFGLRIGFTGKFK